MSESETVTVDAASAVDDSVFAIKTDVFEGPM